MSYLLVALGSALGGVARHWCTVVLAERFGTLMPWGTIFVNVAGSLLIGTVMGLLEPTHRFSIAESSRESIVQFVMVGILGGYTTFSSFSLQTLNLLREHHWMEAGANVFLSIVLCLGAVALGFWLATAWSQARV